MNHCGVSVALQAEKGICFASDGTHTPESPPFTDTNHVTVVLAVLEDLLEHVKDELHGVWVHRLLCRISCYDGGAE